MQGCIQRVLFGDVNAATVRVLAAEGWEVHAPRRPRCCGALQLHSGFEPEALELARETIAAYEGFEAIAVNVAGCGSAMKDYGHLLADDPGGRPGRRRSRPRCATCTSCSTPTRPQAPRHPLELHRRLPRRLPPGPRPGRPDRRRATLLRGIPGVTLVEPQGVGALLRFGRHLQPHPAGRRRQARQAQGRQPGRHRRRGDRRRQPRLRAADRRPPRRDRPCRSTIR